MMKVDLTGQVALVTGAAQNIGRAIADLYAENGARVIYADILVDKAGQAASKHAGCRAAALDITREDQVKTVMDNAAAEFQRLDILVNNAGINVGEQRAPVDQFPREWWDKIINVDLTGTYLVSKAAAAIMSKQGSGRMINISSVLGIVPARLQCAFVAAKAGLQNLTRAMALELGPRGIRVNCIAPGSILTPGTEKLFYGKDAAWKDGRQSLLSHIPAGQPGKPEDIAYAALYLAAPESHYVNGQVLAVDGGWTAGYIRDF